jgi:hypothetical protein
MDRPEEVKRRNRVLADRAEKARRVLEAYGYGSRHELITALVDFLIDVHHLAEADDVSFKSSGVMEVALRLYRAEHPRSSEETAGGQTSDSGLEVRQEPSEEET